MKLPLSHNEITAYGEKIYHQMHGLFATGTIPSVRDESIDGGFVGTCLDEIYDARLSLCHRYGISTEDADVLRIIAAYDTLMEQSATKMFLHGVKFASSFCETTE